MKTHTLQTFHAKTQGRETEVPQRQSLLACPQYRSLSSGPGLLRLARFGSAPLRFCMTVLFLGFVSLLPALSVSAQEVEDTIRIKTRVVFLEQAIGLRSDVQLDVVAPAAYKSSAPYAMSIFDRYLPPTLPNAPFIAIVVVSLNFLVDMAYAVLDPRIRYED